jgi:hypothetical protein
LSWPCRGRSPRPCRRDATPRCATSTILTATAAHVVDAVGQIGVDLAPVARAEPTALDALSPLQARVLDGVRPRKILTAEQIAVAVGVSARDARRALPDLEVLGFVTALGAGYRLPRKADNPGGEANAPGR